MDAEDAKWYSDSDHQQLEVTSAVDVSVSRGSEEGISLFIPGPDSVMACETASSSKGPEEGKSLFNLGPANASISETSPSTASHECNKPSRSLTRLSSEQVVDLYCRENQSLP